jgi:hypothetical protein
MVPLASAVLQQEIHQRLAFFENQKNKNAAKFDAPQTTILAACGA